jgi:hypothetical protein
VLHGPFGQRIPEAAGGRLNFAAFPHNGRVAFELILAEVDSGGANLMEGGLEAISFNELRYIFVGAFGEMKHLPIRMGCIVENDAPQRIEKHGLPILQLPPYQADTVGGPWGLNERAKSSGRLGEVRGCSEPA